MNKLIIAMSLFFIPASVFAAPSMPVDQNGRQWSGEWYGCTVAVQTSSTTPTLVASGANLIDWVAVSSGTTGGYAVITDSATITGATTTQTTKLATPWIFSMAGAGTYNGLNMVRFSPPIKTTNGIVILNSEATVQSAICYRKSK